MDLQSAFIQNKQLDYFFKQPLCLTGDQYFVGFLHPSGLML